MADCIRPCQGCTTTCVNLATIRRDARNDQTTAKGTPRPKP